MGVKSWIPYLFFLGLAPAGFSQGEDLSWLAFGDLRGYLEPCGCDPRTDLGGLRRLATFVQRERALARGTVVFNLGNNLPHLEKTSGHSSTSPNEPSLRQSGEQSGEQPAPILELKAPFFEEALLEIRPEAILVNVTELAWIARSQEARKSLPHAASGPWSERLSALMVLSNATDLAALGQYSRPILKINGSTLVFGYTWDSSLSSVLLPPTSDLAKKWRKAIRKTALIPRTGRRVLLFSGPDEHLREILNWRLFDLIVSSNKAPMSLEPGIEERADPGKLIRKARSPHQKTQLAAEILMVPLGGQGIVRGGIARRHEAKPLSEIFSRPPGGNLPGKLITEPPTFVTWLDSSQDTGTIFESLFNRYRVAASNQFESRSKLRAAEFATTPFAGAEACKGCHTSAYAAWSKSKHAGAFEVLVKKASHKDGECIGCHVVGGDQPGGFVSVEVSPGLAGVQCENCHGPRKAHVLLPTTRPMADARSSCVSCHKIPHSSQFKFEEYWPRIIHGR